MRWANVQRTDTVCQKDETDWTELRFEVMRMKIKEDMKDKFQEGRNVNKDAYGNAVYKYLIRWANIMEDRMSKGETISDMAEETSHKADTEGITGFMHGCAVSILAQTWEYGEELRTWYNSQYGYKGEGTVNPAVMSVGLN